MLSGNLADTARCARSALAELPKGVTVVATSTPDGPVGMTATAVTSLSQNPPLLLVCMSTGSRTLSSTRRHGAFSVNVLRDRHRAVSQRFATRDPDLSPFDGVGYRCEHGVPVLDDALAWLTCRVHAVYPGGDHVILIGWITGTQHHGGTGEPLVWHRRGYRVLSTSTRVTPKLPRES